MSIEGSPSRQLALSQGDEGGAGGETKVWRLEHGGWRNKGLGEAGRWVVWPLALKLHVGAKMATLGALVGLLSCLWVPFLGSSATCSRPALMNASCI